MPFEMVLEYTIKIIKRKGKINLQRKILVVDIAALGFELWKKLKNRKCWNMLKEYSVETVFPALTCPVQASFRTATSPSEHGICANGFFHREIRKTFFWEQSSALIAGNRIWDNFRLQGGRVGQLCWQNSIGNDSDLILSPAPIHKHHGGMIQDFYSRPAGLYNELCQQIGAKFNLFNYWGPFTSIKSSKWIVNAATKIIKSQIAPELFLVYIPHLDYDLQKFGTESQQVRNAFRELENVLEELFSCARDCGYELLVFGDYAINPVENVIFPNKILREKSLFKCREVKGMLYPDLWTSKAFVLVDHQIAHIYLENHEDISKICEIFSRLEGISQIHKISALRKSTAGDIVLEASPGYWFAYQWWEKKSEAPDYASHVDIHNKPGYDPCELILSFWQPFSILMNPKKIRGSHGISKGEENCVFLGTTIDFGNKQPDSIIDAALFLKNLL